LAAPQAWAACDGGSETLFTGACIGTNSSTEPGSNNTVTVTGNYATASGGVSDKDGTLFTFAGVDTSGKANGNKLIIESSSSVDGASGGFALGVPSEATGNTLVIKGTVNGDAVGGSSEGHYTDPASATGNEVLVQKGATVTGNVWGGKTTHGEATSNTVTLAGGTVNGNVWGGQSDGTAYAMRTDNTLVVQGKGLPVVGGGVYNFAKLKYTLPDDIGPNETVLTVANSARFYQYGFGSDDTEVNITVTGSPMLNTGDKITLIKACERPITSPCELQITPSLDAATTPYFKVDPPTGTELVATVQKDLVPVKVAGSTAEGGEVKCEHPEVAQGIGITTCTATAKTGYTFDAGSMTASNGTISDCDGAVCKLSGVTSEATVSATFTKAPTPPTPDPTPTPWPYYHSDSSSPTMGELGLLFSGLALAGVAAPALRRREKQGKKD
ncbi:MAG: hypothetical protein IJR28_00110, partial [Ottowia sp.]|nr:hypothetical protein [Ottowia sp.]